MRKYNLIEVLNIGHHPLCDDLVPIDSKRKCKSYPIVILLCTNCYTAHQKYQINKKIFFLLTIIIKTIYQRCFKWNEISC